MAVLRWSHGGDSIDIPLLNEYLTIENRPAGCDLLLELKSQYLSKPVYAPLTSYETNRMKLGGRFLKVSLNTSDYYISNWWEPSVELLQSEEYPTYPPRISGVEESFIGCINFYKLRIKANTNDLLRGKDTLNYKTLLPYATKKSSSMSYDSGGYFEPRSDDYLYPNASTNISDWNNFIYGMNQPQYTGFTQTDYWGNFDYTITYMNKTYDFYSGDILIGQSGEG